ncbi:unnamed protein product [Parnassius mnemosyne]|uniref:HTH CENPB-type domain-containing protein n=1 Tax=Parnassius mnemosyne TaxID=213953 RepID=A0AAV1M5P4_9NEOP
MITIKRKALSLEDKVKILKIVDEKSQIKNQTELAAELHLPVSTLRTILNNRQEINEKYRLGGGKRKKQKVGKFDQLEKVLVEWLHQSRALKLPISGPILCEKARKIGESLQITDFTAPNGWIDRLKNRHGIVYRQINGESEIVAEEDVDTWIAQLPAFKKIMNRETFLTQTNSVYFINQCQINRMSSREKLTMVAKQVKRDSLSWSVQILMGWKSYVC